MKKTIQIGGLTLLLLASILAVVYSPRSAHAASTPSKWYFAEGRVGSGFRTFFSVQNPNSSECAVNVQYYYTEDGSTTNQTKTVAYSIPANTRFTVNANADVPGPADLSAIVSVDNSTPTCTGIIVERPMYFSAFHGVNSGTDILGATDASLNTTFYFADVPTHSAGESFLSILNPNDVTSNVTVKYYSGGSQIGSTATLAVAANSRGTIQPNSDVNLPAHVSAVVTSDHPILVERPTYYVDEYGVSGSADVMGVSTLAADWSFAEGNTASGTQENLTIANFNNADATVHVLLKSLNGGAPQDDMLTVKANSQTIFNVNANNTFTGATSEVSAEVSSNINVAVQREMFTTYAGSNGNSSWQSQGVTDTFGAIAPQNTFNFAEGFTSVGFNEYLLLAGPDAGTSQVTVSLVNMLGHTYSQNFTLNANTRYTINITQMVSDHLVNAGEDARAYAVSMSVQSTNSTPFVAERTMNWNAFGTQGAESVVGYAGMSAS